jgi:hypothetical protein
VLSEQSAWTLDDDVLDPAVGVKYIGYPGVALVVLALVLAPLSAQHALGALLMAFGYVVTGIGFAVTLVYHRRTNAG